MRKIKMWIVFLEVVLCSCLWAQVPKGNVFIGYSFDRTPVVTNDTINANGWEASLEGKIFPFVGLVADFDSHYGSGNFVFVCPQACTSIHSDVTAHNFLFGPRVSAQVGPVRPFAEFLIGAGHISRSNGISDSDTSFANAVGGGVDYRIAGPVSLRGQLDWVETRFYGEPQNGIRFSTGIAFHF